MKNIILSEQLQNLIEKIVQIESESTPLKHIHGLSLSWVYTGTSVKSGWVKLVTLPKPSDVVNDAVM